MYRVVATSVEHTIFVGQRHECEMIVEAFKSYGVADHKLRIEAIIKGGING